MHRFRYADNASLQQPAKGYLRNATAVCVGYGLQCLVVEEIVATLHKCTPLLMHDALARHEFMKCVVLPENVSFYLIDHRHNLSVAN